MVGYEGKVTPLLDCPPQIFICPPFDSHPGVFLQQNLLFADIMRNLLSIAILLTSGFFAACTPSVLPLLLHLIRGQMITLHYLPWRITVHGVLTMYTIRLVVR